MHPILFPYQAHWLSSSWPKGMKKILLWQSRGSYNDYRGVCKILVVKVDIQWNNNIFYFECWAIYVSSVVFLCHMCLISFLNYADIAGHFKYLLHIVPSLWWKWEEIQCSWNATEHSLTLKSIVYWKLTKIPTPEQVLLH